MGSITMWGYRVRVFNLRRILLLVSVVSIATVGSTAHGYNSEAASTGKPLAYDVVSVRLSPPDGASDIKLRADGVSLQGLTVKRMILIAGEIADDSRYGLFETSKDILISGLPKWAESIKYDVQAKMDEKTIAEFKDLPEQEQKRQRLLMLRLLLADRFHVKFHFASRNIPVYALVIEKGGPKLKEADPNNLYAKGQKVNNSPLGRGSLIMTGVLMGQGISITRLTNLLNNPDCELDRLVVDKTGLTKEYDITLKWAGFQPGGSRTKEGVDHASTDSEFSIFTALKEQLGLKLESTRATVDTIVVDNVETPTEN